MRVAQAQWNSSVLGVAAAVEAVTGLFLLVFPHLLAKLLLAAEVTGVSIVIGRVAGIALLSLGIGCWFGRRGATGGWAFTAMLLYNVMVTLYLAFVGLGTEFVGVLLWPAVVVHIVLTTLLAYAWSKDR